ncbi:MAG: VCBS repeat-containing protein [Gammaproteobacteria bacterium]
MKALLCVSLFSLVIISSLNPTATAADTAIYTAGDIQYARATFPTASDTIMFTFPYDLDSDGDTDVILVGGTLPSEGGGSRGRQDGLILYNNGDNTFTPADGDLPGSETARELLIHDFNGDELLDIYFADHGYDAPPYPGFKDQLMLGTGTGFIDATDRLPDIAAFTHNAAAGDVDGDGDIDIFAVTSDTIESEYSYLLINDGEAKFELNRSLLPQSLTTASQLTNSYSAELVDLDQDGRAELILGRRDFTNQTPTRIHWNNGQGQFSDSEVTFLDEIDVFDNLEQLQVIDIKGMDFNGDGRNDLLVSAYKSDFTGTSIQLFINQGNRVFVNDTQRLLGPSATDPDPASDVPYFLSVLDVNEDGFMDLLPNFAQGTVDKKPFLFEGSGHGCFNTVTMGEVAPNAAVDSDTRRELGQFPFLSPQEFGYGSFFSLLDNGQQKIFLNYVPVTVTQVQLASNYYHGCSGKLKLTITVESAGIFSGDFSIITTQPEVVLQLDGASVVERFDSPEKTGVFDSATGRLTLPELEIDGAVAYRNLVLVLSDENTLQFTLESLE